MKHFLFLLPLIALTACNRSDRSAFEDPKPEDVTALAHVVQELVPPPGVPRHSQVADGGPKVVEVTLVVEEKKIEIAPNVTTWALTFGGTVPGPLIVAHEGDYVQLRLVNPSTNTMMHNIDFHAATGDMGGGDLTEVSPGQEATIRFRCTKAGVFVYHCAPGGVMVPLHVTSGMNGVIMVLPREGLKDENGDKVLYDRAYYVVEQDYYVPVDSADGHKEYATPAEGFSDMVLAMRTLTPSHIVFNGANGALVGANSMKAAVGEKVLFITGSCNIDTRFHLIGGHADLVYLGGSFNDRPATDYETWPVPGGSAAAALYEFRYPGSYAFVDHNLINAFVFGAVGIVDVEGDPDHDLMEQIEAPRPITTEP